MKKSELSNSNSGNGTDGYARLFLQAFKQTQLWKKTKQNSLGKKSPFLKKPGSLAPKTKFLFVQTQCTAGCRPSAACKRCTNKKPELCTLREEKRGKKGQRSGPLWPPSHLMYVLSSEIVHPVSVRWTHMQNGN